MQKSFKEAYDYALHQADEMMNSFNIIMNAGIKQKLAHSLMAVRDQLVISERVVSRVMAKAEYDAEMARRFEVLAQAMSLVNVAAKRTAINTHLVNLKSSVDSLNDVLTLVSRQPQRQGQHQGQNQNNNRRGYPGRAAMPAKGR